MNQEELYEKVRSILEDLGFEYNSISNQWELHIMKHKLLDENTVGLNYCIFIDIKFSSWSLDIEYSQKTKGLFCSRSIPYEKMINEDPLTDKTINRGSSVDAQDIKEVISKFMAIDNIDPREAFSIAKTKKQIKEFLETGKHLVSLQSQDAEIVRQALLSISR